MGTDTGSLWEVDYLVVQPGTGTTQTIPPTTVTGPTKNLVRAASQTAAITALSADVLTGSQVLNIIGIRQIYPGATIYN
jgi:hypothetical protein